MPDPLGSRLLKALPSVASSYHRLLLLVGPNRFENSRSMRQVGAELNSPIININLELSQKLLELTGIIRSLRTPLILSQVIEMKAGEIVLLDNCEMLFDVSLEHDPLYLLQRIARKQTLICTWNGTYSDGRLIYAKAGHPEYRCYKSVEAKIVTMDESKTTSKSHLTGK